MVVRILIRFAGRSNSLFHEHSVLVRLDGLNSLEERCLETNVRFIELSTCTSPGSAIVRNNAEVFRDARSPRITPSQRESERSARCKLGFELDPVGTSRTAVISLHRHINGQAYIGLPTNQQ
jgi:hypothetical protein